MSIYRGFFRKFLIALSSSGFILFSYGSIASFDDDKDQPVDSESLGIGVSFGKWPGTITWVYNSTSAPTGYTDDATTASFIQAGLLEWSLVCGINFQYAGVDDAADIDDSTDGIVVVEWDSTIAPAAGQAGPSFDGGQDRTGPGHFEYTDGVVRLNPNVFDITGLTGDQIVNNFLGFGQTVTHEAGHLIGLGHADDPVSIMWANPYNSLNHLRQNDIDGCRSMYGYSDLYAGPENFAYQAPATGSNTYDFIYLVPSSDCDDMGDPCINEITVDNGTEADGAQVLVRWQTQEPGYNELVLQEIIDPSGMKSLQTSSIITAPAGGVFGIASFARVRELPGIWTFNMSDSSGTIIPLTLDVQTALPDSLEPPGASLTVSENPATRETSVRVDVTSVSADAITANQVTVNWHVGTQGVSSEVLAVPGNSTTNVTFGDSEPHEIHVEVVDDQPRYDGMAAGTGPAGDGFHTLLPYFSSGLNLGPDGAGDNSSDITLFNDVTGELFQWNMHGNLIDPRGAIAVLSDSNWEIVGNADYDGDGKSDFLWRHSTDGRIFMWLMDGQTITAAGAVAVLGDLNWQVAANGDFDGDGNADVIWRHATSGVLYYWRMDGTTILSAAKLATVAGADSAWTIVGDGDFTGDGQADLMWFNTATGQVYLWEMNGAVISSAAPVATVADLRWGVVGHGDYDGDGIADLVWQHRGIGADGKVYFWKMNGATIDSSARISIVGDATWEVRGSGDYNGDSRSDLLWFNSAAGEVYHWQQNGAMTVLGAQIATSIGANWDIVNVH